MACHGLRCAGQRGVGLLERLLGLRLQFECVLRPRQREQGPETIDRRAGCPKLDAGLLDRGARVVVDALVDHEHAGREQRGRAGRGVQREPQGGEQGLERDALHRWVVGCTGGKLREKPGAA